PRRLGVISAPIPYTTLFRSVRDAKLVGATLLDVDVGARGRRRVDGGRRRGDIERNPVMRRGNRQRVRPDLVGDVAIGGDAVGTRSEEHTSELQSRVDLVCRL